MKTFICTGHANYGNGTISSADGTHNGGCNEYLYCAELMTHIKKWLEYAGVECDIDTPKEGLLQSLNDEILYYTTKANAKKYDLVVQLHLNSFNTEATGCEVWYYKGNECTKTYAKNICSKLSECWINRGAKDSTSLYWLKRTVSPAVLIESFFCDNPKDYDTSKKIGMEGHAKLIAEGIVNHKISKKGGKTNGCECGCDCCK